MDSHLLQIPKDPNPGRPQDRGSNNGYLESSASTLALLRPPLEQDRRPPPYRGNANQQLLQIYSCDLQSSTNARPPPHLTTLMTRARRVTDELTALIAKQEESAARLIEPNCTAGGAASRNSLSAARARAATADASASNTATHRQTALADWMAAQLAINKHHSSLTIANTMAILGSRMQAFKLTRALDASRAMVAGLQSQLTELEVQLQVTSGEVAEAQVHNARLKTRVEELQKTCDEAIEHYNRESALHRSLLSQHSSAIAMLQKHRISSQTLAASIVFLVCYLLTGLANPVMRMPLRLASMSRKRQRWSVFAMRVAMAVAAVIQVRGTVGGIVDWAVGMIGGSERGGAPG